MPETDSSTQQKISKNGSPTSDRPIVVKGARVHNLKNIDAVSYTHLTLPTIYSV